jgi:hypothetical protein
MIQENTLENPRTRCYFDMFVRYRPGLHTKGTFCYRGDYRGKGVPPFTEPPKMLQALLRFFDRKHYQWVVVEIYDNTYPKSDNRRTVLKYCNGLLELNRLHNYADMLTDFPMPDWLK